MKHWPRLRWVALLGLATACASGNETGPPPLPWSGATPLTAPEAYPFGVVVNGKDVLYTTGLTQVGDHAVRVAPLAAASPAASQILVADPGGKVPNGALAVDGGDLYVAAGSGVVRVSLATGTAAVVVDQRPTQVTSVAVDDRFVWWTTSTYKFPTAAEVARMPKGGGRVEILAVGVDDKGRVYEDDAARKAVAVPDTTNFHSLVLDGDGVLVASSGAILRVSPGRRTETIVGSRALGGSPGSIVADANRIYAVVAGPRDNLVAVPRAGGPLVKLARDADDTKHIALAGGEVVFFTHVGGSGGRASVNAVPTTGGPVRVVTSGRYANGDIAVTANRVVFSADSRVWSAPVR